MSPSVFEIMLAQVRDDLQEEMLSRGFKDSEEFENRTRRLLHGRAKAIGIDVELDPPIGGFPDIAAPPFGLEVKFTVQDTWRSVANSIRETTRDERVKHIYVMFGKSGGVRPEVKFGKYEDCVMHVRSSHVPRFEVDMTTKPEDSLFREMSVTYPQFAAMTMREKMKKVREYAKKWRKPGEHIWWMGDDDETDHAVEFNVRLYPNLPDNLKDQYRAEAALLCPSIVAPGTKRTKYNDAVMYLLTYRGVLCPQARDLFSAGSALPKGDKARGGNHTKRVLIGLQEEMLKAAKEMKGSLFLEYWEEEVPPKRRIRRWLEMADEQAAGKWKPSEILFNPKKR